MFRSVGLGVVVFYYVFVFGASFLLHCLLCRFAPFAFFFFCGLLFLSGWMPPFTFFIESAFDSFSSELHPVQYLKNKSVYLKTE